MKKILFPIFCLLCVHTKAVTWTVSVENFQITPSTLNVTVGDVIHWVWISGFHTTSSLTVPAGAPAWDSPMTSTATTFDYTVTVAGNYTYQCNIHPGSMQASFTASSVLPVSLSVFTITTVNGKPKLSWTTTMENNTDHFIIKKSTNGTDLKEIAAIPAAGNSSLQKKYSYTDENITASEKYIYYSLGIVDKDGKTQLFPVTMYKNDKAAAKLITSISPNPLSGMGHVMLQFNADKAGTMRVKLIDMQGRTVLETQLTAVQGINNGHVHIGNIPAGTYTMYCSLDGINESYRITKE